MTSPQSLQANLRRIGMSTDLAMIVRAAFLMGDDFAPDDYFPEDFQAWRREAQEWLDRHVVPPEELPSLGSYAMKYGHRRMLLSLYAQALEQAREGSG